MEILFKKIKDILAEELTMEMRGILITIMLCKDLDSRITLARLKTKCKISKIKDDLIYLHEAGFIKWSGYKSAKKVSKEDPRIIDVIEFLNSVCGRNFNPKAKSSKNFLKERLKENSVDDIKLVIANRYKEWKGDLVMEKHLNPTTLFRPSKFEKYLEEAKRTRVGESFVAASNFDLKKGDEITEKVIGSFSMEDTYNIKIYQCDGEGNVRGNGVKATRYGKDVSKMLRMQKFNTVKTHRYFYD